MSDDYDFLDEEEDSRGISPRTGREKKAVRGRPWVAGQSANPSGRPKVAGLKDIRALAREYTEQAIETLVEVMGDAEEKGAARVAAANSILDRGWGKTPQTVVIGSEVDLERLDDASLNEVIRGELTAFLKKGDAGTSETPDQSKLN